MDFSIVFTGTGSWLGDISSTVDGRGNWLVMLLQAFQIAFDCILDVRKSLPSCVALRNASRQSRAFGNKNTILMLLNQNPVSHSTQSAFRSLRRNGQLFATPGDHGRTPQISRTLLVSFDC